MDEVRLEAKYGGGCWDYIMQVLYLVFCTCTYVLCCCVCYRWV